MLALLALLPAAAEFANGGIHCKEQCKMDGLTGQCHTSFCGTGHVACCKAGLKQPPCDGRTMGCKLGNCCTALSYEHAPSSSSSPPPPPPRHPPVYADGEDEALVREAKCDRATTRFHLDRVTHQQGMAFASSSARIDVTPWQTDLHVVLLIHAHGEYIEVMSVEGARLLAREQVGSFLRLAFALDDEPSRGCVEAPCFVLDTVGRLSPPERTACSMPAELTDPPPSPPPRYVSLGELWASGQHLRAPPFPPPPPPLRMHESLPSSTLMRDQQGAALVIKAAADGLMQQTSPPPPPPSPSPPQAASAPVSHRTAAEAPPGGLGGSLFPMVTLLGLALIGLAWLVKTSDSGLLGTVKEMALDGTLLPIGYAFVMSKFEKGISVTRSVVSSARQHVLGRVQGMEPVPVDDAAAHDLILDDEDGMSATRVSGQQSVARRVLSQNDKEEEDREEDNSEHEDQVC